MNEEDVNRKHDCPLAQSHAPKDLFIRLVRTPQEAMRDYREWANEQDGSEDKLR